MKLNLHELKKVAEATAKFSIVIRENITPTGRYLAAFNPTVALALIERIEMLERAVHNWEVCAALEGDS